MTGAVVTLAVVLLVRSGRNAPQPDAASAPSPAAVTTAAREPAPNVKLRGHHFSPHGHHAQGGGATTSSTTSTASSSGAATPAHRAASTRRPSSSGGGGSATTPTVPGDDTPTVPDDTTPPTDTGTTPAVPSDDGSGSAATTTPQTDSAQPDSGVTIPNQATPDGSVGTP
ncbi:hypothetical protein [Conexibacter woesei]|uniref:hypothetical protein n=1 Tax=Conexibacter woesei TaxID=191495 RepID=UPI000686BF04|nr:hypothetical protein [Conexibacter woesei]